MLVLDRKERDEVSCEVDLGVPDKAIGQFSCIKHRRVFSGIEPIANLLKHTRGVGENRWLGPMPESEIQVAIIAIERTAVGKSQDIEMWTYYSRRGFVKVMDEAGVSSSENKSEFALFLFVHTEERLGICLLLRLFMLGVSAHCLMSFPGADGMLSQPEFLSNLCQSQLRVLGDKIQNLFAQRPSYLLVFLFQNPCLRLLKLLFCALRVKLKTSVRRNSIQLCSLAIRKGLSGSVFVPLFYHCNLLRV